MKKSIGDADQSKGDYPVPNNTSAMENRALDPKAVRHLNCITSTTTRNP
jgi:hypothetical protein